MKDTQAENVLIKIKNLIKKKGISTVSLSKQTDIATPTLYNIFNGKQRLSVEALLKIAEVLETPVSFFFGDITVGGNEIKKITSEIKFLKDIINGNVQSLKIHEQKVKNLYHVIESFIDEILMEKTQLKKLDLFNALFYLNKNYGDDLSKETRKKISILTENFEIQFGQKF